MSKKANCMRLGLLLGFIIPILSILLIYIIRFSDTLTIAEFLKTLFVLKIYTKVLAVAVYFGNIVSFFLFIKTERLKSARGVLTATVIYSLIILILRLTTN